MRHPWTWIAVASLLVSSGCAAPFARTSVGASASVASPDEATSISDFYGALSPYGRWIDYPAYGWCWAPDVTAGWRPYSIGRWVDTEYGWTWLSGEPWGWATFHYGRWWFDPAEGWVWVPDDVWGPAWVSWQYGPGWLGWAALPPEVGWSVTGGIGQTAVIPLSSWCFVDEDRVFDRDLGSRIRPASFNARLLRRTHQELRYTSRNGVPVNDGIDIARVERETGRHVEQLRTERRPNPGRPEMANDGRLAIFRPELSPARFGDHPPMTRAHRPPQAGPARERRVATARRHLEQSLAAEQARMQHEHAAALRAHARDAQRAAVERRQAEERKQFEHYAARQRADFERRASQERPSEPPLQARGPDHRGGGSRGGRGSRGGPGRHH